jgi:ferredoxin
MHNAMWTAVLFLIVPINGFAPAPKSFRSQSGLFAESTSSTAVRKIPLSLNKPLGIILEEIGDSSNNGVYVREVAETGSAVAHADEILNAKLSTVNGVDVNQQSIDDVLALISNLDGMLDLEFTKPEVDESESEFELGTPVTIQVIQKDGSSLVLNTKVGNNLRQTLIDNGFEVYQGLKQKLGNCGGAGQCTFCAVDFIESKGWAERTDYESQKLKKFPTARLACLNNIQGPAIIKKTER